METAQTGKTQTSCVLPIVGAIQACEIAPVNAGSDLQWTAVNSPQIDFLEMFEDLRGLVGDIPELTRMASFDVEEVNAFLRDNGFDIQLLGTLNRARGDFATASILDLLVEWLEAGTETEVETPKGEVFPAARIKKDVVSYFRSGGNSEPVVCIDTKSGDKVYMTMLDDSQNLDLVELFLMEDFIPCSKFGDLVFPMVNLDYQPDISWLIGMHAQGEDGRPLIVSQALQQTKLRMNHIGARVESAAAVTVVRMARMPKPDYVINRPFFVWFVRDGFPVPLFIGRIEKDCWANPGGLD